MAKSKVLYSTNTTLSFRIAEHYYDGVHYAWCSPFFSKKSVPPHMPTPPTSDPSEIYHNLLAEIRGGDRHSEKIKSNRAGLVKGAGFRRAAGVIDAAQEAEIQQIVAEASLQDFQPLVFVIPFADVAQAVKPVAVGDRAHPMSQEFILEALDRSLFDVIELARI